MLIEFHNDTHMIWDWRVALDQFFGATGIGVFLATLLIREFRKTAQTAAYIAPAAVAIGLAFLMMEVGRPFSAFYILFGNPLSVMFWGSLAQGLFLVVSILYALKLKDAGNQAMVKTLGVVGGVLAILIGVYHGMLQSVVIARPIWNNGLIPLLSLVSGMTAGTAVVIYLSTRSGDEREGVHAKLQAPFRVLLASQLIVMVVLGAQSLYTASDAMAPGTVVLAGSALFWIVSVAIGALFPFAISLGLPRSLPIRAEVIAVMVLSGAVALRLVLLHAGSESFVFNLPMKLF